MGSPPKPTKRHALVAARRAAGFTQEALAARVGVERSTVFRWESGETVPLPWLRPGLAQLLGLENDQLAALLGESSDDTAQAAIVPVQPSSDDELRVRTTVGGRYALFITTSSYQDATLQSLHDAETDGRLLADLLEDSEVGGYTRVQRLHNPPARAARRAVREFFKERSANDLGLVYFSGHGLKKEEHLFFAATDTDTMELSETTMSAAFLAEQAENSQCGQIIVILDCRYGETSLPGHGHGGNEPIQSALPVASGHNFVLLSATGQTEFVIDAQTGTELSKPDYRRRPSLFTEVIIDGFETGDADGDGDGKVSPEELFDYLKQRLAERDAESSARAILVEERIGEPIVIARTRQVQPPRNLPIQIRRKLDNPATATQITGLRELVAYDERHQGSQRNAVVEAIMSSYRAGDADMRDEITHMLAKLAQQAFERSAGQRRRSRLRRMRRPVAIAAVVVLLMVSVVGIAVWRDLSLFGGDITGEISINGSSTVEPIIQQIKNGFVQRQPGTHVLLAADGTSAGFREFCSEWHGAEEIDLVNASRPMGDGERATCQRNNVGFEEFLIGFDGMIVVTPKSNDFLTSLDYDDLRRIFQRPNLNSWRDFNPNFPDQQIKTCAPGKDSGTFDFFVGEVLDGKSDNFREDNEQSVRSEDDNRLVQCVQANPYAIGFFGYAYYRENSSALKPIMIARHKGGQAKLPSQEAVLAHLYPFSRPLFVYARLDSIKTKPHFDEFLRYLFRHLESAIHEVGYFPTGSNIYADQIRRVDHLIDTLSSHKTHNTH